MLLTLTLVVARSTLLVVVIFFFFFCRLDRFSGISELMRFILCLSRTSFNISPFLANWC